MSNSSKPTRPTVRAVPEALRDLFPGRLASSHPPDPRSPYPLAALERGSLSERAMEETQELTTCFRKTALRLMQPAVTLPQRLYVACGIQAMWSRALTQSGLQADPELWSAADPIDRRATPIFATKAPRPQDCYRAASGQHYDHDHLLLTELDLCDSARNRASARLYRREGDRVRLLGRCESVGELHRFLEWIASVPEFVLAAMGRDRVSPGWQTLLGCDDVLEAWALLAQEGHELLERVGLDAQPVHESIAARWSAGTSSRLDHAA